MLPLIAAVLAAAVLAAAASALIGAVAGIPAAAAAFTDIYITCLQRAAVQSRTSACKCGMAVLDSQEPWCRVYLRTCLPSDRDFMHHMESEAAAAAAIVIALSRSDADYITQHLLPKNCPVPVMVST